MGEIMNPYQVVEDFERALAEYTGAPAAVTTTSCTMALLLAIKSWMHFAGFKEKSPLVTVPKRTYVGVPMSVINAGCKVKFTDKCWEGAYLLAPLPIWDSARWFTRDLYQELGAGDRHMVCVSFHASKTLALEQGGAVLCGEHHADRLRRLRFDGRQTRVAVADDTIAEVGYHCPMIPSVAAAGLLRLSTMVGKSFPPIPNDDYPDLSSMPAFWKGG